MLKLIKFCKYESKKKNLIFSLADCLCRSSSSDAVFPNGCFLLDADRGNLPLSACCESLQHHRKDTHVSRHLMGYVAFTVVSYWYLSHFEPLLIGYVIP